MFFCSYVFKKNMFFCSYVFKKKHVLLFLCLQKNMFFCCESNKSTLLKPFPRFYIA